MNDDILYNQHNPSKYCAGKAFLHKTKDPLCVHRGSFVLHNYLVRVPLGVCIRIKSCSSAPVWVLT